MKKLALQLAGICMLFLLSNCSKSEPRQPETPPSNKHYYQRIRVSNLTSTGTLNSSTNNEGIFYSLSENKQIPASEVKTTNWDIAFSSLYNSFISGNNGSNNDNFGAGNTAIGGIQIVQQAFELVTEVPTTGYLSIKDAFGTDDSGDVGSGIGWYLYDASGFIKGGGAANKRHIAYPLENRTLIVKTANGDIAKIRMLSVYKDQLSESQWNADSKMTYLTFDYVLVPKGSSKFEIKTN